MKKNAFTLIELLIIIAIISMLAAVLVPTLSTARRKALKIEADKAGTNNPTLTVSNLPPAKPLTVLIVEAGVDTNAPTSTSSNLPPKPLTVLTVGTTNK